MPDIMKIIDERKRCDTKCVAMGLSNNECNQDSKRY